MAYTGMTYQEIISKTLTLLSLEGVDVSRNQVDHFVTEAEIATLNDLRSPSFLLSESFPSSTTVNLRDKGILLLLELYADSKRFTKINFKRYSDAFLGSTIAVSACDDNLYYAVGEDSDDTDILYIQPNITEVTNIKYRYIPLPDDYTHLLKANEPKIQDQLRMAMVYKLCTYLCGSKKAPYFEAKYLEEKKDKRHIREQHKNEDYIPPVNWLES